MTEPPRIRVLIADDVAGMRRLLRFTLEESGRFEVVGEAADGEQAVRLAQETRPDLVLLDVSMPVQSGLEALPRLREQVPGARVVVLSGFLEGMLAAKALSLGAARYMEKGAKPDALVDALLDVMSLSSPVAEGGA